MKSIAIVGGGFCGTALAVHLIRKAAVEPLRIVLVERASDIGRGVAYQANDFYAALNVPAGNMSLFPDSPADFIRYCRSEGLQCDAHSFIPRARYGAYLAWSLQQTLESRASNCIFERVIAEARSVTMTTRGDTGGRVLLELDNGRRIEADELVLATGHSEPSKLDFIGSAAMLDCRYIGDPWEPGIMQRIASGATVLVVGAGLTALDIVNYLCEPGAQRRCIVLSRHGLVPRAHRAARPAPALPADGLVRAMGNSIRRYVRVIREAVEAGRENGVDWRDVIASLRPHTPALWKRLSAQERRRFLRHVRPYWDVYRHRTAPESQARFDAIRAQGLLRVIAGRVLGIETCEGGFRVEICPRGALSCEHLRVDYIINCTGPQQRIDRVNDPLMRQLVNDGVLTMDGVATGIEVDDEYRPIGLNGSSASIRYLGPLLRARFWEATAVPELREHAERLASIMLTRE